MPFPRDTLTELRTQTAADINAALPGVDSLLRYSNLSIMGEVLSGLAHGLYGYLDWIALQSVPFTATDEYLEGWAAIKDVIRKPATKAAGTALFSGTSGTIPAGTLAVRADGEQFVITADVAIAGGTATASLRAVTAGARGNTPTSAKLSLAAGIPGINAEGAVATALTGGADVEGDDELRTRMLIAYATPSQGGSKSDYVKWALEVPGVTRCWVNPNGYGVGTVALLFMMDNANAAYGGFPQGTNGVATAETRGVDATGDQLTLANAIYLKQPVTTLVYAVTPTANTINLTIAGISGASTPTKAAIAAAFAQALQSSAQPGGVTPVSAIETTIGAVANTAGFVITAIACSAGSVSPGAAGNITSNAGALPVPGTVTYI